MINIQSNECIDFPSEDVFRAGMRAETWPEVKGITLQPSQEVLALGSILRFGLQAPKIEIDGYVTQCEPSRLVMIEGESGLASVSIKFSLEDEGEDRTNVSYETSMGLKGRSVANKIAESAVKVFLAKTIPVFTTEYIRNITNLIQINK